MEIDIGIVVVIDIDIEIEIFCITAVCMLLVQRNAWGGARS